MAGLFISIYDFFDRHKTVFWISFAGILLLIAFSASKIKVEEDITRFFPEDERVEKLNYVFQNSKFAERIVMMVSVGDSSVTPEPDSLVAFASGLAMAMDTSLSRYIKQMTTQVDDNVVMDLFASIHEHLPVFLEEEDYKRLDSLSSPDVAAATLENNYRQLISPAGIVIKKIIVRDPLGFSFLPLQKLQLLQYDENFELYDGYVMTRDRRHLVFFVSPVYPPNATAENSQFVEELKTLIDTLGVRYPQLEASFFGAPVVAAGNAKQLRNDSIFTIGLAVVFLVLFLVAFFRKKRVPFLIFIPVLFGALFSVAVIALIKGSISILALAAGSVILGIAVNYSLHFLSHLKHVPDVRQVIKDLVKPMTMGSTTTVVAFLCLQFANAAVLRDVGLFAAFSLIGAALCSLIFLPHLLSENLFRNHQPDWTDKLSFTFLDSNKFLVAFILLLTPFFLYFASDVQFNSDMSKLNFMTAETALAQERLETINQSSLTSVYVVSDGPDLQTALRKNERITPLLKKFKREHLINKYASVSTFLISDSLQKARIKRWNDFWNSERKVRLIQAVRKKGAELRFSPQVLSNFESILTRNFQVADDDALHQIRATFFDDYIIERNDRATVISLVNVAPQSRQQLYDAMEQQSSSHAFDRQMLTNLFVEYVNDDFNYIVTFTALLVFSALLLLYGRIELTLITFVPMLITWIWILGIMALTGIEFNIVNVMVSTFIFGLGDDYSIFTMDGLLEEYRVARQSLGSIRTSIFLSAVTTIAGLGVLIFAEHPALRSIAAISIIGIFSVFIMSQSIEPFLFRWLVTRRTSAGLTPMTFHGIVRTAFTYTLFVIGAISLTVVGLILTVIPFGKRRIKLFYHSLLSGFARLIIYIEPTVKKRLIGFDKNLFSKPSIIIANHSSFLDILLTIMLHPKVILVTNRWVWDSPIFGSVVRLADYFPASEGADEVERLKDTIADGYSVVIFPEGTRSKDGKIGRFHKGAFYMAEKFGLDVCPLLIHGAADAIPKNTFYLNAGQLTLQFLPPISPDDSAFGNGYAERTKKISRHFKEQYAILKENTETPRYYAHKLISNYIYKGPVLEWYMRVKIQLERYYEPFHRLLPLQGKIIDLGCGYGFMSYMLQFLSEERTITGVDYDEEKIAVATNGYLRSDRLSFFCADVTVFPLTGCDGIVISDVLHYLSPEKQQILLERCMDALNPAGVLIVREGNADLVDRHKGTQLTEFFSVKVMKFNKSINELNFLSGKTINEIAARKGMTVEISDDAKYTSNVIFVIRKRY